MMSATAGRSDHAIKGAEDPGAVLFGRSRLFIAAAVGHGLAAARLFFRVYDLDSQSFEQLEGRYADTWIEHVNVTRDQESNLHFHFALLSVRFLDSARSLRMFQLTTCELSKHIAIANQPHARRRAAAKRKRKPGFRGNRLGTDVSNLVLAENGQCHDRDRKAKVNRMTLRSRCSLPRSESLTQITRNRGALICLRRGSAPAGCLQGFLRSRIKSHQTCGWGYKNQGIRKRSHVTGVSSVLYVEFSQLELQQAHIDDITGNS